MNCRNRLSRSWSVGWSVKPLYHWKHISYTNSKYFVNNNVGAVSCKGVRQLSYYGEERDLLSGWWRSRNAVGRVRRRRPLPRALPVPLLPLLLAPRTGRARLKPVDVVPETTETTERANGHTWVLHFILFYFICRSSLWLVFQLNPWEILLAGVFWTSGGSTCEIPFFIITFRWSYSTTHWPTVGMAIWSTTTKTFRVRQISQAS